MLYNIPYYPTPTGFINATGFLIFDINQLNNFDFISINNNEIFYHDNPLEFGPPNFFNNKESFIENVNNTNIYNVYLTTGLNNIIYINSTLLGSSGNNISLNSNNTGVIFSSNTLLGGENIYSILKKPAFPADKNNINLTSPLFSGKFTGRFFITGFYSGYAEKAFLNGNINSFEAVRSFNDVWDISTGFVNFKNRISFKSSNYINNSNYSHNINVGTNRTPINLQISYNNALSIPNNIDIVELKIKDLNAPSLSLLSGIIFRITGLF